MIAKKTLGHFDHDLCHFKISEVASHSKNHNKNITKRTLDLMYFYHFASKYLAHKCAKTL